MKKVIVGLLLGLAVLTTPIQASANANSNIDTSESDGVPYMIRQYAEVCGSEYNICPEFIESIAFYESSYKADAKNGTCVGLMQVNISAHKDRIAAYGWTTDDMTDPYKNMMIACDYLQELFEEYEDIGIVHYIYNGNSTGLKQYLKTGKLNKYATKILDRSAELERIHGK